MSCESLTDIIYESSSLINDQQLIFIEPILDPKNNRYSLYPIQYSSIWDFYKRCQSILWTVEEVDLTADYKDWLSLKDTERHFLSHILAFFASSDLLVNENLNINFINEVTIPEAKFFYNLQAYCETIHSEQYTLLLETYIRNEKEKAYLFNAIANLKGVKVKAEWCCEWISSSAPFAQRLFAFACVEGIFFCGSFCAIFWMSRRNLLPGLKTANQFISKDESHHVLFAAELYKLVVQKLDRRTICEIITSAVKAEKFFIQEALNVQLIGMNADLMKEYIHYCADRLLLDFGEEKLYHSKNPFDFMENQSMNIKTNFFEHVVTEYAKFGFGNNDKEHHVLKFDDEF
jgi:ribonucleoside-diphosphate reductase beta chain